MLGLAATLASLLRFRARACVVLACVAAMLCTASIASSNTTATTKTRVWDFSFAAPLNTCPNAAASQRTHLENRNSSAKLASASSHAARGAGETTNLFRAVMQSELDDIALRTAFRNPAGIEVKYFSTSGQGAASYARQAARGFGDGPFTVVGTSIPTRMITPEMMVTVDRGIQTVVVPTQSLRALSTPQIWNFTPLP